MCATFLCAVAMAQYSAIVTPSVVAFTKDNERLVGMPAKRQVNYTTIYLMVHFNRCFNYRQSLTPRTPFQLPNVTSVEDLKMRK